MANESTRPRRQGLRQIRRYRGEAQAVYIESIQPRQHVPVIANSDSNLYFQHVLPQYALVRNRTEVSMNERFRFIDAMKAPCWTASRSFT